MYIDKEYFKEYRRKFGFTNQQEIKSFLAGKDISPTIDFNYIDLLNKRLENIIDKLNILAHSSFKRNDIDKFKNIFIRDTFIKLKDNNMISKLNNQGRRPEQVYFSWMRGFIVSNYFLKALSVIFEIEINNIAFIGDDDLKSIKTFKRTPKADLEINLREDRKIRIEIQSGFQGINDIKQHKVLEAKRINQEENIPSLAIHFDLFNGQVAFIKLYEIEDNNANWITRQQMEGQTVFNIDQNSFLWKLTEKPPKFNDLDFN